MNKEKANYGKTKIPMSEEIFRLLRNILLSSNNNIHLRDIIEINRFLSIIDFNRYTSVIENIPANEYLGLLQTLVETALSNNSTLKAITIQSLLNESKDREKFQILYDNREEISNEDLSYVKSFMSDHVSASYIFNFTDHIVEAVTKINSGDYKNIEEVVDIYKGIIFDNYRTLNQVRVKSIDEKLDSGLAISELTNLASETIKKVSTPGFFIDTGLANLDKAMGGGLKRGALTLFGARTAGFKSGLMLNLACSIKMFSRSIETFDKTKKACVVYLSMENLQSETFQRMVKFALNKDPMDMVDANPETIASEVIEALTPPSANPDVELKLLYKRSNSIDINDIRNIVDDIETDGFEVVALFVDYLSTMNSVNYKLRDQETTSLAVADNSRVLYDFAIEKSIAIVSAYQLNRKNYEKHNLSGKEVLAHTGDSIAITRYADYIFVVNKDKVIFNRGTQFEKEMNFLRFDEAKQRSTNSSFKGYFHELFEDNNSFRLIHSKYFKNHLGLPIDFEKIDGEIEKVKKALEAENKAGMRNLIANQRSALNGQNNNQQQAMEQQPIQMLEVDTDLFS